ncbi:NYN domain-containing protein [Actinomadura latina]|uniref:NYN domain-containing protein n=1 Tax=Actinomadura latina TaxID=163603 RepID=A0A846Z8E9_9ACTN|nr:NYN domain-containing protein [Actinomadura latina]NKZ06865.1 NYN domain-containing protein [Actinomadura latina]
MDRCALFVDAGYLLADGAMAVHGTRHRETVSWDFGGLLQLLGNLARERTGMPLLRCYWYEATIEGRRSPEHDALADLPGLKLRLGRVRPGRHEGVDTEVRRDLMTLARNGALADAVLVSGDEDLAQIVADAQDLGVRVTVVHVAVDGNWTISRVLRQECDDLIEIGSGHLRPYVNLLAGMDGAASGSSYGTSPLSNGHGASSNGHGGSLGSLQPASHNGPPPASLVSGPPAPSSSSVRDLGPAMTGGLGSGPAGGNGVGTGPMPVPGGNGGGLAGSSYGTGGQQAPLHSATTSGPSPLPGPSSAPIPSAPPMPPSHGPQYGSSPVPAPSPPPPPQSMQPQSMQPQSMQPQSMPSHQGGQHGQHGPYTGPQQMSPVPAQNSPSLADAVKAAHQEGQDFGESVARDAPALWLEAVLARKPRMPSDLEARLLQGSSLPIDFLLHDEVRHALRRGFWDALERSRR